MQLFRPTYEVEECVEAIRNVLASGWTGPGPQSKKFEDSWNSFTGAKHSHFLNSATAALHIALRMQDLPKGSKVLTTALTFVSTNAVILYEGHIPVFVDINEDDLSLDSDDFIAKAIEHRAKAAIWVHYGGQVSPHFEKVMKAVNEKAHPLYGMKIIEDCAHVGGAYYQNGQRVGSRNDTIACFSYQAVKNLPTFDSGMICCPETAQWERAKRLAWLGIDKDTFTRTNSSQSELYKWSYDVPEVGWKYNGNDIAAAIANTQLKYLDRDNARRREMYHTYLNRFEGNSQISLIKHSPQSAHHLVVLRVKHREHVIGALKAQGIACGVHYLPNNEFPIFKEYYTRGSCPNLERISAEIISLPNHLQLTQADLDKVADTIIEATRTCLVDLDANNKEHLDMMYAVRTHPTVNQFLTGTPPNSYEEHVNYLSKLDPRKKFYLVKVDQALSGYCQLTIADNHVEIGMALHPDYMSKGIGSQAMPLLLEQLQHDAKLQNKSLLLFVKKDNPRAIALYSKYGFVNEGQENEHGEYVMTYASK